MRVESACSTFTRDRSPPPYACNTAFDTSRSFPFRGCPRDQPYQLLTRTPREWIRYRGFSVPGINLPGGASKGREINWKIYSEIGNPRDFSFMRANETWRRKKIKAICVCTISTARLIDCYRFASLSSSSSFSLRYAFRRNFPWLASINTVQCIVFPSL